MIEFRNPFQAVLCHERNERNLNMAEMADLLEVSRTAYRGYENKGVYPTADVVIRIASKLGKSLDALLLNEKQPERTPVRVKVFREDDRCEIASILVRNGYTVRQGKEKRTPGGKAFDYYLYAAPSGEELEGE